MTYLAKLKRLLRYLSDCKAVLLERYRAKQTLQLEALEQRYQRFTSLPLLLAGTCLLLVLVFILSDAGETAKYLLGVNGPVMLWVLYEDNRKRLQAVRQVLAERSV